MRGELRAVVRASQDPQLRTAAAFGERHDITIRMTRWKLDARYPVLQFLHLPRKFLRAVRVRIERTRRQTIRSRCAPHTQIDSARCNCLENAKLFGHFEGGVMR